MRDLPIPRLLENPGNTTHGSGWMVQVQPTRRRPAPSVLVISPLAARGERVQNGNLPCAPM
jgi:hypothetical protein